MRGGKELPGLPIASKPISQILYLICKTGNILVCIKEVSKEVGVDLKCRMGICIFGSLHMKIT